MGQMQIARQSSKLHESMCIMVGIPTDFALNTESAVCHLHLSTLAWIPRSVIALFTTMGYENHRPEAE
jgi:hypothetical protein